MFRTTEISDAKFESDHLRFITVKTPNLKGRGDICVFVPPLNDLAPSANEYSTDLPLVILLHGVYGSSWSWSQNGGAHRTALRMMGNGKIPPMVIAMPSDGLWGDGSGYLPHDERNFEQWIVNDVPTAVIENITSVSEKSLRFIAGLSMGGFGAMRLGLKYGQSFEAISAHSAITDLQQMEMFVEEPLSSYLQEDATENSVFGTLQKCRGNLPNLRFDCGTEDQLIRPNRKLHKQLSDAKIEHTYREFPGGHEWPYWQEHLKDTLLFFSKFT